MKYSRRNFLQTAGIATTVALAQPGKAFAMQEEPAPPAGKLPEAIARLKSRKDEAKPITTAEREQRIERARQLMAQNKIDAIMLMGGTSLVYFSNIHWWMSERTFALILPVKGAPFYVCPAFEEDRAREQIAGGPGGNNAEVRTWQEDESPYQRIAEGLKDRKLSSGVVGMEETVRYVFSEGLSKAAPGVHITSATPVTAGCRMIKSAHELQLMTLANQVTLAAYEAAYLSTKEGMTQHDFGAMVQEAHARQGFQGGASIQVGENSALPHGSAKPQVIREGTILLMDGGCTAEGYESDISRTVVLG
ncbi:MAG TPA: Xaa-Pro peptidase family protein, partial [Candidatus Angelobacter sp.]|nr:Xaa-Pro peptidase family protein [Candidatus Angelobacter sp.]